MLKAISECKSDEVVRSKPVTIYLNRKWNSFGYNFYFYTLIIFILLFISTNFISVFAPDFCNEDIVSVISLKGHATGGSSSLEDEDETSIDSDELVVSKNSACTTTPERLNQELYKMMFGITIIISFLSNTFFTIYECLQIYI